jgi:hypothetical protein
MGEAFTGKAGVTMADADQEAQWRAEFETVEYDAVRREHTNFPEPKRQFAIRWLREKEKAREARDEAAQWYLKWTFCAAAAAVIVGIIGLIVTYMH